MSGIPSQLSVGTPTVIHGEPRTLAQVQEAARAVLRGIEADDHPEARYVEAYIQRLELLKHERGDQLADAWAILANAGGGNWEKESPEWREAAARWRDNYHAHLRACGDLPRDSAHCFRPDMTKP